MERSKTVAIRVIDLWDICRDRYKVGTRQSGVLSNLILLQLHNLQL